VIKKTKWGTFEVVWRDPARQDSGAKDKRHQKTFETRRAAQDFEDKLRIEKRQGTYVTPVEESLQAMAELYLEAGKRHWRIQTYNKEKRNVSIYINPSLGVLKLTALTFERIEKAGDEWRADLAPGSVNKVYATINRIYKFARRHGIQRNPMLDVERMGGQLSPEEMEAAAVAGQDLGEEKAKDGTLRPIGADEVLSADELWKLIDASTPGLDRAKHMTAVFTGLRHGELNGLRWSTVDLKIGRIFVNRSLTQLKGGALLEPPKSKAAYRYIKIPAELVAELRRWKLQCPPSTHGYVFCNLEGKPMQRKYNNTVLKRTLKRAKVRELAMNNLRHSFASQHLIAGTPPLEVSKLMGHSDPAVTLTVYARWCLRENSVADAVLAARIFKKPEDEAVKIGK
jgi:integrase